MEAPDRRALRLERRMSMCLDTLPFLAHLFSLWIRERQCALPQGRESPLPAESAHWDVPRTPWAEHDSPDSYIMKYSCILPRFVRLFLIRFVVVVRLLSIQHLSSWGVR